LECIASSWFGLLAPAGTPADIVQRVQQETAKALALPAMKERLLSQGAIPSGMTPAEFVRFIAAETKKWAQVVKASGAKVD
jgi:tripartite-type tricarboxylate transporter receptor subunit TctC